ncbi:Tensin-4 [Fukomys damarensis]|uniref:Tensin-4 n=1 Tax=Fukomys damarensis TaxID=885580 RepID=A0A091CJR0_FUKDA|nr:Tensin-4 [Fukomys damarensis]
MVTLSSGMLRGLPPQPTYCLWTGEAPRDWACEAITPLSPTLPCSGDGGAAGIGGPRVRKMLFRCFSHSLVLGAPVDQRQLWDVSESGRKPEANTGDSGPMSQVMPGSLLAGSHTARLEEPRTTLHAALSPSLPPPCPYYTTEGWGAQALMAPTPGMGPPSRLQQVPQPNSEDSGTPQDLGSYIDFSLETLNQMILELDPTFQLLPAGSGGPQARPGQTQGSRSKEEPEAIDIKYIEVTSQSLLHSSVSSHQSSSRSLESPASSSSSLHSLGPVSLCTRPGNIQAPGHPALGPVQPRATHSPPLATEHASSCPPSIANSMVDIPIVLINRCPEPLSAPPQRTPGHQGFIQAGAASPNHPGPATESCTQTLPDAPSAMALEGPARDARPTMKFVMDTSKYWFKPSITRGQAIELLKKEEPGAFVIRDSSSYRGSFGLALKVPEGPACAQHGSGEDSCDLIRHFLIESSAKGVHLKGADEEPYFGSLSAFVCQHSIMALALPCPLAIPQRELGAADRAADHPTDSPASGLKKSASCHTLYLSSVSVETLSGGLAVQKAISATLEQDVLPTPTVVHFRVTEQGITLTDVQRKVFFRRHYPLSTLRFCGVDPEQRKWQKYCKPSRIFGFVAKNQTETQENVCHLFAEYDPMQPAAQVIGLVLALLQEAERM